MHKYRLIAKKGEGTFSEVLKAQCVKNGKMTAIKCMKSQFESEEQVNNLREIQALRRLSPHPGIIKLVEVLYEQPTGRLALVFELMDMNIYELIRGRRQYLPEARVKSYMYQLIKAMDHMHRNGIFHRDIKPENILIADDVLKLADFGSCRGIYSKLPYTEYISTRWYRAPECLLTDGYYNYKMDLWGVGCVFFEIVSLYPLFPGTNELDQIHKIHNILGTPSPEVLEKFKKHATHMELNFQPKEGTGMAKLIAHASEDCIDLLHKLLAYNPEDRLSARQAMRHEYLKELRDLEKKAKRELMSAKEGGEGSEGRGMQRKGLREDGEDAKSARALPTINKHGHDTEGYAPSMAPSQSSLHAHSSTLGSTGPQMNSLSSTHQTSRAPMGLPELSSSAVRGMPKLIGGDSGAVSYKAHKGGGSGQNAASNKFKSQIPKRGPKMLGAGSGALGKHPEPSATSAAKYSVANVPPEKPLGGSVPATLQMQIQGSQSGGYGGMSNRGGKYSSVPQQSQLPVSKFSASAVSSVIAGPPATDAARGAAGGKNYQSPYSQKYIQNTRTD